MGWVWQFSLLWWSLTVPTPGEYCRRVLLDARNVASFSTSCTTMVCSQVFHIIAWQPHHVTCHGYPIPPPEAHNPNALIAEHPSARPGFWALFNFLLFTKSLALLRDYSLDTLTHTGLSVFEYICSVKETYCVKYWILIYFQRCIKLEWNVNTCPRLFRFRHMLIDQSLPMQRVFFC